MSWIVILCIYSYTIGFLLCFYAGMVFERKNPKPRTSARVIRPAVIVVKPQYKATEYVVKSGEDLELDFPPVKKVG